MNMKQTLRFRKVKINPVFIFVSRCHLLLQRTLLLPFTVYIHAPLFYHFNFTKINGLTIALFALVQIAWCPWCYSWIIDRLVMSLPFVSVPATDTKMACLGFLKWPFLSSQRLRSSWWSFRLRWLKTEVLQTACQWTFQLITSIEIHLCFCSITNL